MADKGKSGKTGKTGKTGKIIKLEKIAKLGKKEKITKPAKLSKPKKGTDSKNTESSKKTQSNLSGRGMEVSDNCVKLVAKYEGCRLSAYRCPAGVWTIGYGHTENVKRGDCLSSVEEAKKLLKKDLKKYAEYVNKLIANRTITFTVNQNMFDALTSFVYNCGVMNLTSLVRGRTAGEVSKKMLEYCKGGGKVLKGLERRRKEEQALFLKK